MEYLTKNVIIVSQVSITLELYFLQETLGMNALGLMPKDLLNIKVITEIMEEFLPKSTGWYVYYIFGISMRRTS